MFLPLAEKINKKSIVEAFESKIYVNKHDTFGDLRFRLARYLTLQMHAG